RYRPQRRGGGRGAPAPAVPRSAWLAAAAATPAVCVGPGPAPAATGPTPLGVSCAILVNWPGLPPALSSPAPARLLPSAGPEAADAAGPALPAMRYVPRSAVPSGAAACRAAGRPAGAQLGGGQFPVTAGQRH